MIENTLLLQSEIDIKKAQAHQVIDLLDLMQKNLNLLLNGKPGAAISVTGTNLFALAAKYYANALLWTEIADVNFNSLLDDNGLLTPNLSSVLELVIPPKAVQDTGGIFVL